MKIKKILTNYLFITCLILYYSVEKINANEDNFIAQDSSDAELKKELIKQFQISDNDEDHQLNLDELTQWVKRIHNAIIEDNVNTQFEYYEHDSTEENNWQDYETTRKDVIVWEKYRNKTYLDYLNENSGVKDKEQLDKNFDNLIVKYEKRWKIADEDGNNYLTRAEFKYFVHPEESKNETILLSLTQSLKEELDLNNDNIVSYQEYLDHAKKMATEEEKLDPEFDEQHKNNFEIHLDENKDGALNDNELKRWIIPNYDKHKLESNHILENTDKNRDGELQLDELLVNVDKFYNLLPPDFWTKYTLNENEEEDTKILHDEF